MVALNERLVRSCARKHVFGCVCLGIYQGDLISLWDLEKDYTHSLKNVGGRCPTHQSVASLISQASISTQLIYDDIDFS